MTSPVDGILVVDKPPGMTSHDVVARIRRVAGTRRVGHAGTLDPMATGVLVLGVGRATRLLGHLGLTDKRYLATIRLGQSTTTDDAEGEVVTMQDASAVAEDDLRSQVASLTGTISQVPSSVSAVKVDGRRAYARVRAGEQVRLPARTVTVSELTIRGIRRGAQVTDVDVGVHCSSGTYVRALARDLGERLGVGGHLVALRRTAVGPYGIDQARTLDELAENLVVIPLARAAAEAFPARHLDPAETADLRHGRPVGATGQGPGPVAAFAPDGTLVALVEESGPLARPLAVLDPA